jgi:uncharacterized protein (TIGR03790 family)
LIRDYSRFHSWLDLRSQLSSFYKVNLVVIRLALFFALLAASVFVMAAEGEPLAARLIVLANSDDPESLQLARYYMEKRHVPDANLIALPMPKDESLDWRQFIARVYQPVQDELIKRGWIQAIEMSQLDKLGRKKYAISGHRISYLVVCRGVPLRVEHDQSLYEATPPLTDNAQFRTNSSAVDAELALLSRSGYPINAMVPNPLFTNLHPTFLDEASVVKVTRLDGPTYADAAALVDNAIKAEQQGLIGRAYVDIGGPHPEGDKWLEATAKEIEELGYELEIDRTSGVFPATARFDAPVLYFGWYASGVGGPFTQPGFRFPPGAIALHIHSYSAQTLRSADADWCGPLIARGVTATFGNVHEPYLTFTHHPQLLLRALAVGKNLGDAACFSLPALSWQGVTIGDPLYRPFAVSFADQWQRRKLMADDLFAYVVAREVKRLAQTGQLVEAVTTATEALRERPGLVLALSLARLSEQTGKVDATIRLLNGMSFSTPVAPMLVPAAAQLAQFFANHGAPQKSLEIYQALLAMETLSLEQRLALLPAALKVAETSNSTEAFGLWKKTLDALSAKMSPAQKN